jgi:outer membrane protein OmpA-like peptidoglycan-associated protein
LISRPAESGPAASYFPVPIQLRISRAYQEQDMKTKIIALTAAMLVASTGWAGNKSDKNREEGIGIGSGGIVGAIAGGPVGFIIGAAAGGWFGNKFHDERTAKNEFADRYAEADALAASLQSLLSGSENELEQMRFVMREREDDYRDALSEALDIEVYFRTGDSALDPQVAERVARLSELMQEFDDFAIVVEGHADPRGDDLYNEQLSAERAAAVRETLIRAGLPAEKITTRAAGESGSRAAEGDLDAMALERRVDLSIVYPTPRENRVARQ